MRLAAPVYLRLFNLISLLCGDLSPAWCGSSHDIDDIAQEAFLRAYNAELSSQHDIEKTQILPVSHCP